MKNSTYDLNEELDSHDVDKSLEYVAAITGNGDLKNYKQILKRQYNIDSLAAAKLVSNMILELQSIISYTPAMIRPTSGGEVLRTSLVDSMDHLSVLRMALIDTYENDEGYEDVKLIRMEQKNNDKEEQ